MTTSNDLSVQVRGPLSGVTVVVPCYRSRDTLAELVRRLNTTMQVRTTGLGHRSAAWDYEVILVVDGSPDDTYAVACALAERDPRVRTVLLRRNYGQHNALLAGVARARFDHIVTMDDDLQHRPEDVLDLAMAIDEHDVDLVYAVSHLEEHGLLRSFSSRAVKSALSVAGVPHARNVGAFRAFRTELRDGFLHVSDSFASLDVLLSWTTTRVHAVEVTMDERAVGSSSYTLATLLRHAWNMITGYGTLPLKIVSWLGGAFGILGASLFGVVLWRFFTGATTVSGFTSLASMIAVFCGAQLLSIGVLGEYIGRLHFRSMQRPTYLVKEESHSEFRPQSVSLADELPAQLSGRDSAIHSGDAR